LWSRIEDWIGELQRVTCALDSGANPRRQAAAQAAVEAAVSEVSDGASRLQQLCQSDTQASQALCAWWASQHLLHRCVTPRHASTGLLDASVADLAPVAIVPDTAARAWAERFLLLSTVVLTLGKTPASASSSFASAGSASTAGTLMYDHWHTRAASTGEHDADAWRIGRQNAIRRRELMGHAAAVRSNARTSARDAWWVTLSDAVSLGSDPAALAEQLYRILSSGVLALPEGVASADQRLQRASEPSKAEAAVSHGKRPRDGTGGDEEALVPGHEVVVRRSGDGDDARGVSRVGIVVRGFQVERSDTAVSVAAGNTHGGASAAKRVVNMPSVELLQPQRSERKSHDPTNASLWPQTASDRDLFVMDALLGRTIVLWQS
jgi:hypothetical protein